MDNEHAAVTILLPFDIWYELG